MRFLVPLSVVLAVAAFHSALSASLESGEKEEEVTPYDGLTQLQKIDQMEFDAAQKTEAVRMNITEEHSEDSYSLEAVKDESEGASDSNGDAEEGDAESESESESSEGIKKGKGENTPETSTLNCAEWNTQERDV